MKRLYEKLKQQDATSPNRGGIACRVPATRRMDGMNGMNAKKDTSDMKDMSDIKGMNEMKIFVYVSYTITVSSSRSV